MAQKHPSQKEFLKTWNVLPTMKNTGTYQHRVIVGTPTLGNIRIEWATSFNAMVMPTNWSSSWTTPIGYLVDDAQNIVVTEAIERGFEWVFFLEDDVVPPVFMCLKLREYMNAKKAPIVSGLYHIKGSQRNAEGLEPIIYRGRGVGPFRDFKPGQKIWVDGVPTGCLLVHISIFQAMIDMKMAQPYTLRAGGTTRTVRKFFESPRGWRIDPQNGGYEKKVGTSDLYFCDTIRDKGVIAKAGWTKIAAKEYPFLVDTEIRCGHIDRTTGEITI